MESSADSKPSSASFDPFSDRRSRDIRNKLSEAFVCAIKTIDASWFEAVAMNVIAEHPDRIYQNYIEARLRIYRHAFDQIQSSGLVAPAQQVPTLWNHGLFFEVHELLEEMWHPTNGRLRQALKGLIQAAGVYVHLEQGNQKAAAGLAKRALSHLEEAGDCLVFIDNIAVLARGLRHLDLSPPCLKLVEV